MYVSEILKKQGAREMMALIAVVFLVICPPVGIVMMLMVGFLDWMSGDSKKDDE